MQSPLSPAEYVELLDCARELHRCRALADFPAHVLRALAPVVPSTLAAFNEVNLRRGRTVVVSDRHVPDFERLRQRWEQRQEEHPLVRYVAETGDGRAVKLSDFLSEDEFHALGIYREVYAVLGAEDQMAVAIRSDDGIILALAFNRERRSFSETDRVKLNLLRPHVLQAYANLEDLEGAREERADLETALRETGHGLIALDARGDIAHATPGAIDCLGRYFDGPTSRVPRPILDWLGSESDEPYRLHARASTLIVRRPQKSARPLLLVSEADVWLRSGAEA